MVINEQDYIMKVHDRNTRKNLCNTDNIIKTDVENLILDLGTTIVDKTDIEYAGTFVLEKSIYFDSTFNNLPFKTITLGKSRVVSVNPGSDNIGREQKFIHFYIILAEHTNMFIGIPITNMAFDNNKNDYILRNPFEIELKNPSDNMKNKPFNEYWVTKPSVADLRNICGLDKRRILDNNLLIDAKYAPIEYMSAIKSKMKIIFSIT